MNGNASLLRKLLAVGAIIFALATFAVGGQYLIAAVVLLAIAMLI